MIKTLEIRAETKFIPLYFTALNRLDLDSKQHWRSDFMNKKTN